MLGSEAWSLRVHAPRAGPCVFLQDEEGRDGIGPCEPGGQRTATTLTGFEQSAATFAAQRGFPAEIGGQLRAAVLARLGPSPVLLEPGIGTGRIAAPFVGAGDRYVGLDSSPAMLARCRATLGAGGRRLALIRGDMRRLPFGDRTFDAVVAASIFRAALPWHMAATEVERVLSRPGIIALIHHETEQDSIESILARRKRAFLEDAGVGAFPAAGANDAEVAAFFVARGATLETFETVPWTSRQTPRQAIERHLRGQRVAGQPFAAALRQELEAFARARYGSLDAHEPVVHSLWIRILRLPAQ